MLEVRFKLSHLGPEKKLVKEVEASDEVELDLTPGALEKTNDLVCIYLRRMGMVPLLTREGEVDIAKRIERGRVRALKALSRSPIAIRQIIAIREDLNLGVRSIKEIVLFDEDEVTEEMLQNRAKDVTTRIHELQKHYKRASQLVHRTNSFLASTSAIFAPVRGIEDSDVDGPLDFQWKLGRRLIGSDCQVLSELASALRTELRVH